MPSSKEFDNKGIKKVIPKLRVVITCVTFETVKVVKPLNELRAEKVYILHYDNGMLKDKPNIYREFFEEVVRQLKDLGLKDEDIIERNLPVFRFKDVMSEVVEIMSRERAEGNEVYVNVSAGTMEFAAAATVAAMMVEGVRPFTVHTRKYTISGYEDIKKAFSIDGRLVGQCREVAEPEGLPTFHIDQPREELVIALRELRRRKELKKSTNYTTMIQAIKDSGAWTYDAENIRKLKDKDTRHGERVLQAEKMYYSRHYIDGWKRNGWVDGKDGRRKEMKITPAGENVTDIFYLDKSDH